MPSKLRLLTPQTSQQSKNILLEREILRTREVQEASDKARKELANTQADFKESLAKNMERWAQEEESHQSLVRERTKEISVLEERKKQALIPISIYEERAEKKMKASSAMYQYCQEWENRLKETQESLEDRLDDVSEQKKSLDSLQSSLEAREEGLRRQEQQTSLSSQRLSEALIKFEVYAKQEEIKISQGKKEILMDARTLESKQSQLESDKQFIKEEKIRLADMRKTLERAMARLKV